MLQLILGKAGFGKTEYIRKKALELCQNGEEIVLLVPDQMSFETEKYMLYTAGEEIFSKMKVYQFHSLCEDVFTKYGGISEKRIDDSAKNLIMSMAISACADKLELYKDEKKSELISLMIKAVDEFKSAGINATELFEIKNDLSESLGKKIYEFALIFEAYDAILQNSFISPSDIEKRVGEILLEEKYFANKILLIDGFEGFDSPKTQILSSAFRDAKQIFVSFCIEDIYSENKYSIFAPIQKTAQKIISLAKKADRKVLKPIVLDTPHRFKSDDLKCLENNLFRDEKTEKYTDINDIKIYQASDIYSEIEYISATIKELVFAGKKYSDITVICRNSQKYTHLIETAFKKWQIPAFVSMPRSLENSALIRLVLSCFAVLDYGFSANEILNIAKTKLCGLNTNEISTLENYLYLWKIDGAELKKEFTKSPFGFSDKEFFNELEILENLRKKIVNPIINLKENCKESTGISISKAVYNLLLEYNASEHLLAFSNQLEQFGRTQDAEEQERVWGKFMDILDQFANIIGEQKINYSDYGKILKIIISKNEIINIPQSFDSVIFGTADNIKRESDIVFLIGAIVDEFPQIPSDNGIFSTAERDSLSEMKIELPEIFGEKILLERYFAYISALSAREKIYISYHISDGKTQFSPSELVTRIGKTFGVKAEKNKHLSYFVANYDTLFSSFAKICREKSDMAKTFYQLLKEQGDYNEKLQALERISGNADFNLSEQTAKNLFSHNSLSPSQIDKFHQCKFWYFCSYGLGAKERKIAEIDVLEYGSLMHFLFEKILQDENFKDYQKDEIKEKISVFMQDYIKEKIGSKDALSTSDLYRFKRMSETAITLITRIIEELSQSEFSPKFRELKFAKDGDFPPLKIDTKHGEYYVKGIADRVDVLEKNGKNFARVVDYKTGTKEFQFADVLNGLSLQMLIYLSALRQENYSPAGALYLHSALPNIPAKKSDSTEKIKAEIEKKMCMDGLVLKDESILKAMESEMLGKYIPVKIKVKQQKGEDGKKVEVRVFDGENSLLTDKEFDVVFRFADKIISKMVDRLLSGNISAVPLLDGHNYCKFCQFDSVCSRSCQDDKGTKIDKEKAILKMEEGLGDEQMD
ncbi:MAG: PD-(D/E)XK nuclease family protein [Clostridia bacterium]